MSDLTIPQTEVGLDVERLVADLVAWIRQNDDKAKETGTPGSPRHRISFRAPWRDDEHPSAYVKPTGGDDGSLVWGDSGTGDKGGWRELAAVAGFRLDDYRLDGSVEPRAPAAPTSTPSPAPAEPPARAEIGTRAKAILYDYRDAAGRVLCQKVRLPAPGRGKTMYLRHPADLAEVEAAAKAGRVNVSRNATGDGAWWLGQGDAAEVLYRLPELVDADPSAWVVVVEGEKDAETVAALGLVSTTPMHKWHDGLDVAVLAGRRVAVFADHDAAGKENAEAAVRVVAQVAREVSGPIWLPDEAAPTALPDKAGRDITDWLGDREAWGRTVEQRRAEVLELIETWRPPRPAGLVPILEYQATPVEWLFEVDGEGLLPGGDALTLMYGRDGQGKTTVALFLAAEVERLTGGPVVYVAAEDPAGAHRRALAYARRFGERLDGLDLYPRPVNLLDKDDSSAFAAAMMVYRPRLVVVDPWSDCVPGADENDHAAVTKALSVLKAFRLTGIPVLLVHHSNAKGERSRGHSALEGQAGTRIRVYENNTGLHVAEVEKQRNGLKGKAHGFRFETVDLGLFDDKGRPVSSVVAVPTAEGARPAGLAGEILGKTRDVLAEVSRMVNGGTVSFMPGELVKRCEPTIPRRTVTYVLGWARNKEILAQDGDRQPYRVGPRWPLDVAGLEIVGMSNEGWARANIGNRPTLLKLGGLEGQGQPPKGLPLPAQALTEQPPSTVVPEVFEFGPDGEST